MQTYKCDCYWYNEWRDMGATIPQCGKAPMGACPCAGCDTYISRAEVQKLVDAYQEQKNKYNKEH